MPETIYVPKGEMCINCKNRFELCNELPFNTYPKIEQYMQDGEHYTVVICKNYEPK